MGEIADSMIEGEMCAACGVYFDEFETVWAQVLPTKKGKANDGYPVLCEDCK